MGLIEPGKYKISFEDYLADPCPEPSLSRSCISLLLDSPAKAFWNNPRLNPNYPQEERDESKFDPGKAAHNMLLEGGGAVAVIDGFDNWKKDAAQSARDEARENGKTPLLRKQFDAISAAVEAAKVQIREVAELGVADLAAEGDAELTYVWQECNGVWCRIRPDWIRKDRQLILDYKLTGTNANPDNYSDHINRMDYPIQSVFYRRGIWAAEKEKADFVFIAQENEPPYLCSFHGIDFQNEDMACEKVNWAIDKWRECLDTGNWPGYPKRVCYSEPKPWDLAAWEMKKHQTEVAA